jgi:hypothetical protein
MLDTEMNLCKSLNPSIIRKKYIFPRIFFEHFFCLLTLIKSEFDKEEYGWLVGWWVGRLNSVISTDPFSVAVQLRPCFAIARLRDGKRVKTRYE